MSDVLFVFPFPPIRFNPTLHCGYKIGQQKLEAALGLKEGSVYGLAIQAHNRSGLRAACQWVRSTEGKKCIADNKFEAYSSKATKAEHSAVDQKVSGTTVLLEGKQVVCGGVEMECVKQAGERVRLKRVEDGKIVWRKLEECALSSEKNE